MDVAVACWGSVDTIMKKHWWVEPLYVTSHWYILAVPNFIESVQSWEWTLNTTTKLLLCGDALGKSVIKWLLQKTRATHKYQEVFEPCPSAMEAGAFEGLISKDDKNNVSWVIFLQWVLNPIASWRQTIGLKLLRVNSPFISYLLFYCKATQLPFETIDFVKCFSSTEIENWRFALGKRWSEKEAKGCSEIHWQTLWGPLIYAGPESRKKP